MISCSEFLARYSDFRDELLDSTTHHSFERHLESCGSCARYDRVVEDGIATLLRLPEVTPSADFVERLDLRLAMGEQGYDTRATSGAPVALVIAVAASIGAAAWLPALRPHPQPQRLPAAFAHSPYHPQLAPSAFHPELIPASPSSYSLTAAYRPEIFSPYALLTTSPGRVQTQVTVAGH
jgi:hypothetical protein